MWWKLPLLILLSAPLGYRVWREIETPPVSAPAIELPAKEDLAKKKAALQELQKNREVHAVDDELAQGLFRVSGDLARSTAGRPAGLEPLVKSAKAHAAVVQEIRDFARVHAELESDPDRPAEVRDEKMKGWLREQRDRIKRRKDNERALLADLEKLNAKFRAGLRNRQAAELERLQAQIKFTLVGLKTHRTDCEGFRTLMAWADRRIEEWTLYLDLLAVAQLDAAVQKSPEPDEVTRHLGDYGRLVEAAGTDRELQAVVRNEARRFCEGYLPLRMAGDDMVLYRGRGVPRRDIQIRWKADRPEAKRYGETVRLTQTRYDEFSPPDAEAVEYYFRARQEGDDTFYDQIEPTPKNRAARYYTDRRKKLAWTENGLQALITDCPVRWSTLESTPIQFRLAQHVLDGVRKHPALFGSAE
jgi:hypothetical protein